MASYNYTKVANLDILEKEINSSSITIALSGITLENTDNLSLTFKASLSVLEEATLDGLIVSHDGSKPSPNDPLLVDLNAPKDSSNRPIFSQSPFSDTGGFRFRGASFKGICPTDVTTNVDYLISEERWINGGRALIDNIGSNDTITFQVIDIDDVFGFGNNVVLDEFITEYYVPSDGNLEVRLPYPARITAGLYLRLKYTSTHVDGCELKCNLYLHWKTV